MDARTKASVLWGLTGALAFLVLAQAYVLLADPAGVTFLPLLGVATAVFAITTLTAYYADKHLH